ncbi:MULTISPECIES: hypothetical protein [Fibrobacter]|nr:MULTISPECIES: hypothetical protein [Fibrobacter]MDD7299383.1 hypothetical protein [Fibrobacter intestinalis]
MMRNKRMLLFLLWSLFWGFANAEETTLANGEFPLKQGEELSTGGVDDSLSIYNALIVEESLNADYRSNVTGMIFGGVYVGLGSGLLAGGIGLLNSFGDESFYRLLGVTFIVVAIPFYLVGVPILISNIDEYRDCKGHANRRDEYIDALKRYKDRRENSVQWMLVPSVNLANAGGGLNLLVAF